MPYKMKKDGPDEKPWCVYNTETGDKKGCSKTEAMAKKFMAKLYLEEGKKEIGTEDAPTATLKEVDVSALVESIAKNTKLFQEQVKEQKTISEKIKALWNKVFPIKQNPSFYIKELENGQFRWVGISSTAFLDDEEEIISMKALANIKPLEEGDYGPLQFWHVPLKLGTCDFQAADGVCLVESGLWNVDPASVAMRKAVESAPQKWGVSVGFVPTEKPVENVNINGVVVKKIWDGIQTKERSILPAKYAANKFTCIVTEGGITVDKEKEKVLREILGDDLATQTIEQITALNEKAESKDAVVKDVKPEPESVPEPEEKETPKPEISKDELTAVLKELQTLPERFKKLEGDIQKLKEDLAPRSALEQARASEAKDNLATEEEVEKAGPSDSGVISQMVDAFIGA